MIALRHYRVPATLLRGSLLVRTGGLFQNPRQLEFRQKLSALPNLWTTRQSSTHMTLEGVPSHIFTPVGETVISSVREQKVVFEAETLQVATPRQVRVHMLNCAVPMIGFGFMDNMIMIQAGELIDTTFGVTFGLSTLTAAALGQICSDFSGVCFGGGVEALATRLGLPHSGLTRKQLKQKKVKVLGTMAAALGVVFGCVLGMSSLLFMDLDKAERLKRQRELKELFCNLAIEGAESLNAERATIWLLDADKTHMWSMAHSTHPAHTKLSESQLRDVFRLFDKDESGSIGLRDLQVSLREFDITISDKQAIKILHQANESRDGSLNFEEFCLFLDKVLFQSEIRMAIQPGTLKHQVLGSGRLVHQTDPTSEFELLDRHTGHFTRNMLICPIVDGETKEVIGCIEIANKMTSTFGASDEKILSILSNHAAIFMKQCAATAPSASST
eukprot:c6824_g1_i1.p1 GENE.c6824_g1_i1~~c6824_g1_i1.p1  ORF type:complete len:445 (-),score=66.08 c6824_g1_i1:158-1492(-)